jgi:hypothetical protein
VAVVKWAIAFVMAFAVVSILYLVSRALGVGFVEASVFFQIGIWGTVIGTWVVGKIPD